MPKLAIDFSANDVYECGAVLFSALAVPEPKKEELRARTHAFLCAQTLRAMDELDDNWRWTPQRIKPGYLLISDKDIKRIDRDTKRRLGHRMVAARMAIAFLQESQAGRPPKLPKGVKRLSVNQLADMATEDVEWDDAHNVEARVWRPSLPVIHIAAAIAVMKDHAERAGMESPHLGTIMLSKKLISEVVRTSREYDVLLGQSKRLTRNPESTVHLKLVGLRCSEVLPENVTSMR